MFITKRGDLTLLGKITFSIPGLWSCSFLSAFIAELFFCTRIWIVGRRMKANARFFVIPVLLLALLQICSGIAEGIVMAKSKFYTDLSMNMEFLLKTTAIQGAAAVLADIVISATLVYIFNSNRTGLASTNSMINKLITYAINRAVATSFCAFMAVILYYFCSGTLYFLIAFYGTTHLYVLSAVSMLTSREYLRDQAEPSFHVTHLEMSTGSAVEDATNSDLSGPTKHGFDEEKHITPSSS